VRGCIAGAACALLLGCGNGGNAPPPDGTPVGGDGGADAGGGTDALVPGTDAGTDGGSDAGWIIPAGCGVPAIALATLGFAPVAGPAAAIPGAGVGATVSAVEVARLTFTRDDTGTAYYFRTAGPTLVGAFSVGEAVTVRASVDPVTQLATHVVESGGATRAAALFLFGSVLPPPNASGTGTGLTLAYGPSCTFPDARGTCGRAPLDVERRPVDTTGSAGTLTLWAGDQGLRDGFIVTVVDALLLPAYASGSCAVAGSAYLGVTFLASP